MRRTIIFLFSLLASIGLYGQAAKLPATLLWRISGKSLSKPSYLFGTMHLTDKKIFQLGDSLYKAIEQTEGFAAELDLNRLGMQMVNYLIADKEAKAAKEPVKVKDAVSPEVWERYREALQQKFYKPAEKITVDDLEQIESLLENDLFKKGDMPTFLDAHLFGLARKQGKWVGGLEQFYDQIEHINAMEIEDKIQTALFDDKHYRYEIENMIKIYTAQMLDSLDALMYRAENGQKDYIMIKRNLKMAKMMDSLSSVRSTFFAVGAAHLPGDSGVISLLQKEGFIVTPVFSSRKISTDKYVFKSKQTSWTPVEVPDSVYRIEMPGLAENMEMLESIGLKMKLFFDISFMKMYMTFGLEISDGRKKLGRDSLFSSMRNRMIEKSGYLSKEKNITINGIEGKEFTGSTEDGEMKMQVFIPNMEMVVVNAVYSLKKNILNDDDTEKFFQSFAYNGIKRSQTEVEKTWSTLSYPQQLFSIEMPSMPRVTKDVKSEEGKIVHSYQAFDIKNQVFYGMSVTSVKEGRYQPGLDSNYFESIKEGLKSGFKEARVLDSSFISFMGYPGYRVRVTGMMGGETIETKVLTVARGSRIYYLFALYSPAEENMLSAERYLGSFRLLPPAAGEWNTTTSPDSSFSLISHVPLKRIEHDEDDFHRDADRFILYDSIISATVYIDKTALPEWLWCSSDTVLLRQRANEYKSYNDSIIDYTVTNRGNRVTADFTVITPGIRLLYKVKLILNGDELFELFGHFDPQDYKEFYKKIFDQFTVKKEAVKIERDMPQVNNLAIVLQNADPDQIKRITSWWNFLQFSKSDLPALQKMLLKVYPDFDSIYSSGINRKLFEKVAELDTAHTTVSFIKENYIPITAKDENVMPLVFDYLAGVKTAESYSILKKLIVDHPFKSYSATYSLYHLYDSLQLTATLFPEILKHTESEAMSKFIHSLTITLLDSGMINKKMIADHARGFINYAKKRLDNNKEDIEANGYYYYDCIHVLGIINSPESNKLLARFAKFDNRGIRYKTIIAQVANNQPFDSRTIYTMATTDQYRHDLYIDLKKIGKLKLFPFSFLSQAELGKSKIYNLSSTESVPALITHAGEKIISYKGKEQKFFLYKVAAGNYNGDYYLGVAGPYSLNYKVYESSHEVTGVYWKEKFDAGNLDKLFNEFMYWHEKEDEDDLLETPPVRGVK